MEKLIQWLTFSQFKGSRTKIAILIGALVSVLQHFGIVSEGVVSFIMSVLTPFGLYAAVEHFEKK